LLGFWGFVPLIFGFEIRQSINIMQQQQQRQKQQQQSEN